MEVRESEINLLKDALEMILIFDELGRITYANAAAVGHLGYTDGLTGIQMDEIFPGSFQRNQDDTKAFPDFDRKPVKLTAYRKNRTCFPVEARIRWVEDLHSYVCMANDILEKEFMRKELEQVKQEASEAMKVKSEFVANVTHELRTPVNGVLGNVRELLGEETDKKKLRNLHIIERCCDDMNKLINNILDFSKLEAGKLVLESRSFHFRNMIDYVKSTHQKLITEKGLEFFVTVSPGVPEYVVGDELRIVQILNNLLSNARKFTSAGRITLEVIKTAQMRNTLELFFIVSDTGVGIAPKDEDKLFQSFSQVDASISRKFGGTGLGLNISKQLVELMGGSITVESREHVGSTFSFSLWVGGEDNGGAEEIPEQSAKKALLLYTASLEEQEAQETENQRFGTKQNIEALQQLVMKLVLSIEMDNWDKAEMFMESIRQLTKESPRDVGRIILRLKMAIQKEDYDKSIAGLDELKRILEANEPAK